MEDNNLPPVAEEKKNDFFKIFIILIGVLVVFGLFLNAYLLWQRPVVPVTPTPTAPASAITTFPKSVSPTQPPTVILSPTPDPTAGWKEYTSADRTYLFKYPSIWKINDGNTFVNVFCEKCQTSNTVDLFQVTKIIYKSIEEYIQKNTVMTDYKKIKFNNREALMVVIPGGPQAGGSSLTVFTINNGQGYELAYRFTNLMDKTKISDFPEADPDILSTFRFD